MSIIYVQKGKAQQADVALDCPSVYCFNPDTFFEHERVLEDHKYMG